ncbi:cupin domain-containing protein [Jannaschia sp. Os4]|uniref:cupin domain-containing protein n=1 Tax=Jannaschia sp. Os4 TaxID=2807617 RepID=UPI00193960F4|nr:cupin domain-containing protein [Jannaschia sp. Os4]MBM2575017.1 cupin domain-containing protein [Jannaschia sp. Os4]
MEEEIPAGAGPPLHVHDGEHGVFTVISGRVRSRAGDDEFEAGPGDVPMIPLGVPHAFEGVEDAVALVMLTPGAASKTFAAVTASGADPATDMDTIVRIAGEHDVRFVGPPLD